MNSNKIYLSSLFGLAIVAALVLISAGRTIATGPVNIAYIDVGQGDAILLRDPGGFDVLIDGGRPAAGPTVVAFLKENQVYELEVMIVTHPDADHVGGLINVLNDNEIVVGQVLYNGYQGTTVTWSNFATAVADNGLEMEPAQYPQTYSWGEMSAYVLNPVSGLGNPEPNSASVVVLVQHGANRFLFTGDIDSTVEATVVARGTPVAAEVLKVGHHGSASSSSAEFLAAVGMAESVIQVGEGNTYGHPRQETLDRLLAAGARIWRTDLHGTVYVTSEGAVYTIVGSKGMPVALVYLPVVGRGVGEDPEPGPTPAPVGDVRIVDIFYDGVQGPAEPDEYVEIQNFDSGPVQLAGWTLRDNANITFTFPAFVMAPGQVCRVYTNEDHPEWCGFSYGRGSAIWNNGGDCGFLRDGANNLVDEYCYP
jgi:competence protein ComEC